MLKYLKLEKTETSPSTGAFFDYLSRQSARVQIYNMLSHCRWGFIALTGDKLNL